MPVDAAISSVKNAQEATSTDLMNRILMGRGDATLSRINENAELLLKPDDPASQAICGLEVGSEILGDTREAIMQLFELNMRELYESSSFGWNVTEKREELFHPESRILYVHDVSQNLLAYGVFRFDTEDTLRPDTQCSVVYCYELQVQPGHQSAGLGKLIMQAMEVLAQAFKIHKVMLTVFKANTGARNFYERLSYKPDEICPSNGQTIDAKDGSDVDYLILSKVVATETPKPVRKIPQRSRMVGGRRR